MIDLLFAGNVVCPLLPITNSYPQMRMEIPYHLCWSFYMELKSQKCYLACSHTRKVMQCKHGLLWPFDNLELSPIIILFRVEICILILHY